MDEKSSWMRVAVQIAIDWRFMMALVLLVLALPMREPNSRQGTTPCRDEPSIARFLRRDAGK